MNNQQFGVYGTDIWFGLAPEALVNPSGYLILGFASDFLVARRESDGAEFFVHVRDDQPYKLTRKRYASEADVGRTAGGLKLGQGFMDEEDVINLANG